MVVLNGRHSGGGSALCARGGPGRKGVRRPQGGTENHLGAADLSPPLAQLPADVPTLGTDGCLAQNSATSIKLCVYGDKTSHKTMLIYGDSHASMWQTALDLIYAARDGK